MSEDWDTATWTIGGKEPRLWEHLTRDEQEIIFTKIWRMARPVTTLTFTTPPPLSANHMYRPGGGGRRILTDAAVTYKAEVQLAAQEAANATDWQPSTGYCFTLRIWYADKRRTDIDNAVKLTLDATAAALGFDDRLVQRIVIERAGIDKANPRGEVILATRRPVVAEGE